MLRLAEAIVYNTETDLTDKDVVSLIEFSWYEEQMTLQDLANKSYLNGYVTEEGRKLLNQQSSAARATRRCKDFDDMWIRSDTIPACDSQTDRLAITISQSACIGMPIADKVPTI